MWLPTIPSRRKETRKIHFHFTGMLVIFETYYTLLFIFLPAFSDAPSLCTFEHWLAITKVSVMLISTNASRLLIVLAANLPYNARRLASVCVLVLPVSYPSAFFPPVTLAIFDELTTTPHSFTDFCGRLTSPDILQNRWVLNTLALSWHLLLYSDPTVCYQCVLLVCLNTVRFLATTHVNMEITSNFEFSIFFPPSSNLPFDGF